MRQESKGAFEGVVRRGPETCRLVVTMNVTIPRELWPHYEGTITDAVDCLRQDAKSYEDGYICLEDLLAMADDISVVVTK